MSWSWSSLSEHIIKQNCKSYSTGLTTQIIRMLLLLGEVYGQKDTGSHWHKSACGVLKDITEILYQENLYHNDNKCYLLCGLWSTIRISLLSKCIKGRLGLISMERNKPTEWIAQRPAYLKSIRQPSNYCLHLYLWMIRSCNRLTLYLTVHRQTYSVTCIWNYLEALKWLMARATHISSS